MRRLSIVYRLLLVALFACFLGCQAFQAAAAANPAIPPPRGFVNDFAGVLSGQAAGQLTAISESLEQATGVQMAFVIVPTTAPVDSFTYSMAVFDAWKLGQKGQDNGLLILLALQEHKIEIRTGYGLEGILPDGKVGRFRDEYLIPFLKRQQTGEGLANIGLAFAQEIAGAKGVILQGAATRTPRGHRQDNSWASLLIMLVALIVLAALSRSNRRGYRGGFWTGPGGFSGGGGGFGGGFSGFGGGFSGGGGASGSW